MRVNTINFIGCGKLGKSLANLFKTKKAGKILGICNSTTKSSQMAVDFIGEGIACKHLAQLPLADITFITTPDDSIRNICEKLSNNKIFKTGSLVVHCSGSLSSEILKSAQNTGCFVASIHPVKSFADPIHAIQSFEGTYCGIEGDNKAVGILSQLFQKIGGIVFSINQQQKALYHAASVFANNYLTTLHYCAVECYTHANINEKISKQLVSMLMQDALNNIQKSSHQNALTGPIQRGDSETIKNHIASLQDNPILKELYIKLGEKTLDLTTLSKEKMSALQKVFHKNNKKR